MHLSLDLEMDPMTISPKDLIFPMHSAHKKNPWWKLLFQWTEESIDFPSMVRCLSWKLLGKLNLIFSNRKNHIFIEIGWELKKI
jgi:hypothetical protein